MLSVYGRDMDGSLADESVGNNRNKVREENELLPQTTMPPMIVVHCFSTYFKQYAHCLCGIRCDRFQLVGRTHVEFAECVRMF